MALSKERGNSAQGCVGEEGLWIRAIAPFKEMMDDFLGLFSGDLPSQEAANLFQRQAGKSSQAIPDADMETCTGSNVLVAFIELAEDIGIQEKHAWAAVLAAASLFFGPAGVGAGSCWVMLGGYVLPLQAISGSASVAMAAGAFAVTLRRLGAGEQAMQRRWIVTLLLCGGIHAGLTCFAAVGSGFTVIVQICKDTAMNPLLIASLGCLAGLHKRGMIVASGMNVISTASLALVASCSSDWYRSVADLEKGLLLTPLELGPRRESEEVDSKAPGSALRERRRKGRIGYARRVPSQLQPQRRPRIRCRV